MLRTAIVLSLSTAVACSAGGRITLLAGDDGADGGAGADIDAAPDATDDANLVAACGPAPYVSAGIVVRGASVADQKGTPLPGARFTSPLCQGIARISGADGTLAGPIAKSTPIYGRLEKMGYVPILTPELVFEADVSGVNVSMPPTIVAQFVAGFTMGKTAIVIGAMKGGGTGACDTLDGITYTVVGHPDAMITYYSTDTIPQPTGGSATTTGGRASIAGLPPGAPVTIVGTKSGCIVDTAKPPQTGRAPLEADFLTLMAAYLKDAIPSDAGNLD